MPPHTTIRLPVQAAACSRRGTSAIAVAVQVSAVGSYRPPVLKFTPGSEPFQPPQTTMTLPVQTAVWACRPAGAFTSEVGVQLSIAGSYLPPVC